MNLKFGKTCHRPNEQDLEIGLNVSNEQNCIEIYSQASK